MEIPSEIYLIEYDHRFQSLTVESKWIEDRLIFGREFNLDLEQWRNEIEGYQKEWIENLTLKELIDNFIFYDEKEANEKLEKLIAAEKAIEWKPVCEDE